MAGHDHPFTYPASQLSSCASSLQDEGADPTGITACRGLLLQHASHYNRPSLTSEEEFFFRSWTEGGRSSSWDIIRHGASPRIRAFLKSVEFVHSHDLESGHEVGLNRFSDLIPDELPFAKQPHNQHEEMDWLKNGYDAIGAFIDLASDDLIMEYAERIRQNRLRRIAPQISFFSGVFTGIFDSWWWIGGGHGSNNGSQETPIEEHSRHSDHSFSSSKYTEHSDNFVLDKDNELDGLQGDERKGGDWDRYLNWSTEENPDGVAIVHDPMDQGLCGSCWAISALGSLEASIVRNMAYLTYEQTTKHPSSTSHYSRSDLRAISIANAQSIERKSLKTATLSVQELVDCDTRYDQGCAGGNPLLAFYFLHRFGVTSESNYPYSGKQDTCLYHKVDEPVASVETWGILTPDHENNMEKVLRYIGPVAVGLIGAEPSFLSYKSGIYSTKGGKCDLGVADHAMLIVGYGEEDNKDGTKTKYWIARNSWGTGWGENGYIRMERIGGRKGSRGVCGISRSPSVALGGMFTKDVDLSSDVGDLHKYRHNAKGRLGKSNSEVIEGSSEIASLIHRIRARLGFVEKGIMMNTLNGSEEGNETTKAVPFAELLGVMSLLCFLTYVYRRRSSRRLRMHNQIEKDDTSAATNLSTACVCEGIRGDRYVNIAAGEETPLLRDCSRVACT